RAPRGATSNPTLIRNSRSLSDTFRQEPDPTPRVLDNDQPRTQQASRRLTTCKRAQINNPHGLSVIVTDPRKRASALRRDTQLQQRNDSLNLERTDCIASGTDAEGDVEHVLSKITSVADD